MLTDNPYPERVSLRCRLFGHKFRDLMPDGFSELFADAPEPDGWAGPTESRCVRCGWPSSAPLGPCGACDANKLVGAGPCDDYPECHVDPALNSVVVELMEADINALERAVNAASIVRYADDVNMAIAKLTRARDAWWREEISPPDWVSLMRVGLLS